MKISKIISVSMLAGAVLLSGTACSANNDTKPTASSQPSTNTVKDEIHVVETVNGYYSFITSSGSYDKVKAAGAELVGKAASDDQLNAMVSNFPEGFKYFDTSNAQNIKSAYQAMMLSTGSLRDREGMKITVPEEAVAIDGNTATVNTTWITLIENGSAHPTEPESNPDMSDYINLVKKDDGSWVIVAKESSMKVSAP